MVAAVSFALGVLAVFITENDAGSASLLAVSVALLALVVLADRISSFEAGGVKLGLAAADQLARADVAAQEGRVADAAQLRESAMSLLALADPVSSSLERVRRTMPSSWERTAELEKLMLRARALATADTSPQEVRRLFTSGGDGDRISAIGIMQARPEFADADCLTDAVVSSRSAFEQYQALKAVDAAVSALPDGSPVRDALLAMVADALSWDSVLPSGSDRRGVAEQIMRSGR